jgi:thioredoxin-related protein
MLRSLLLLTAAAACGAAATAQADPAFATGTLAEIRASARTAGKALVIDFSSAACEPCRRLLATTWRDDALWRWLDKRALAARIDPEQDRGAEEFALTAYPTIVVLDKEGKEVARWLGWLEAKDLLGKLGEVVDAAPTDYRARLALADKLKKAGDLDAAMAHYLWIWDHAEEHDRAITGVRRSFFITKLDTFAKTHPPLRQALEQRIEALDKAIRTGPVRFDAVADLVALARPLDSEAKLVALLDELPAAAWHEQTVAHGVLLRAVVAPLAKARRYADALRLVGDPVEFVTKELRRMRELPLPAAMRQSMVESEVRQQAVLIEICFGARDARTDAVVDQLFELDSSVKTWLVVLNAAKKADNDVACHDYAVRALQELPEEDHERVRSFLRKK